ncbi:hypothetical protein BV20DRAFT_975566 [Pilatotrama ljubarskyi]|nr:hypothetical protein BV20DRAFT_975566 [Pilatotrama ljubarskyi]
MTWKRLSGPRRAELSSTAARCLSDLPFNRVARKPKRMLEDLPTELLYEIFRLACTDGGRTGCSLSLVSHRVRVLSRAARFNTLTLTAGSIWQIARFLRFLEDTVEVAKRDRTPCPRVRHLCVVTTMGGYGWCWDQRASDLRRGIIEHTETRREGLPKDELTRLNASLVRRYQSALQRLFRAVSADLESLCLLRRDCAFFFSELNETPEGYSIICDGFPKLRELYFSDGQPILVFTNPAKRNRPFCPALTKLSVVTSSNPKTFLNLPFWARHAPNLTYLRIIHHTRPGGDPGNNYLPALQAVLGRDSRSSLWPKLGTLLLLYDPALRRDEHDPEQLAAHNEHVKEVYRFVLQRVPFAMCMAWYEKQDVHRRFVRWHRPDMLWNSETVWLDWLHRSAEGSGAFVPNFWEDFLQAWIRRKEQGAKRTLWKRLLASLRAHKDDQRSRSINFN